MALHTDLRGLTLSSLSKAVNVSPRMLIYHFGSVATLVEETLVEVQRLLREKLQNNLINERSKDTRRALLKMWHQCASDEMAPYFRSYYFLLAASLQEPAAHASFIDFSVNGLIAWTKANLADHAPAPSEADHTLICGVIRGLLIDLLATGERERTTKAFKRFLSGFRFGAE